MCNPLHQPLTELPVGATLRIHDGRERGIAVFEGQVWITQDNDPRDTVIGAGESFTFDRPGLALVQAFRDTRLLLIDAVSQPASSGTRISSYELHRAARAQRAAAVAGLLARGVGAVQVALARGLDSLRSGWAGHGRADDTRPALQARG